MMSAWQEQLEGLEIDGWEDKLLHTGNEMILSLSAQVRAYHTDASTSFFRAGRDLLCDTDPASQLKLQGN